MKKMFFHMISIATIVTSISFIGAYTEPEKTIEEKSYRTLDELKEELREERKKIDEQRLEEIKMKQLEREEQAKEKAKEEGGEITEDKKTKDQQPEKSSEKKENKQDENIPSLIVRLRGKHSAKYLCSYNFIVEKDNVEAALEKNNIDNYEVLLKKQSLKVRVGEVINFEFSEEPEKMIAYIWGEEVKEIPIKRGTIKVPDVDQKIVVGIEGQYKNGKILYAVVLDVRG